MAKYEKIWVKSARGKALFLADKEPAIDSKLIDVEVPARLEISQRMAEEDIAVEVYATDFIRRKITIEKLLVELPNKAEAKKKYDDFMRKVKAEQKDQSKELDAIDKLAKEIGADVEKRVKEMLRKDQEPKK